MIHLYLRAIRATSTKELEDITIDTTQYYLKRTNKIRLTYTESAADSIFITSFESHGLLLNIIRPPRSISIVDAYYYTIAAPYFVSQGGSPGCYVRVVVSFFFASYPWAKKLQPIFKEYGIPHRQRYFYISSLLSLYQVAAIKISHGMKISDFSNIFSTLYETFIVAVIHLCLRKIVTLIKTRIFSFIPETFISLFLCYLIAPFIQRLARFGISNTIIWIFESILRPFVSLQGPGPELPEDIDIPQCLTCSICRDLFTDPIELSGKFFCANCLKRWFRKGAMTNPLTGEHVSKEMVSGSLIMETITQRFRKLALQEYNAKKAAHNK